MARKKKEIVESQGVEISIKVNGITYKGSGTSIEEAVLSIPKFQPKTRAVLIMKDGDKESRPLQYSISQLARLFFPGMTGNAQRINLKKQFAFFS